MLDRPDWVLGCVYFTFLEAFGLDERYYFPSDANLYGNCIWSADDWDDWSPSDSFAEGSEFYFSVVQVGPGVTADAVRRRIRPYLEHSRQAV